MIEPTRLDEMPAADVGADFENFFRAEYDRLFQALFLLTGDTHEADDVAQDAFLRVFERWDRVSKMESPAGYVYRTALNAYRSRLRKLAVRARRVFRTVPSEDISGSIVAGEDVRRALAGLPSTQREAIVLVEWLGLPSEEAGGVLGIDAASVRGRIHRGWASMRRSLGDGDV